MADEVEQLRDQVRQLQEANDRLLQHQASAGPANPRDFVDPPSPALLDRLMYLPRERKCPVFRGRVGVGIDDWVEEVEACVRARRLGALEKAFFIFDHLEGEAKEEIRYRPRCEREDPEKIINILRELYGCSSSYVALQEKFFSRTQQEGESLQEYSPALLSVMDKIKQTSPESVPQSDKLLRDQFIEHVLDPDLCRELKRLVRLTPQMSMWEARTTAIQWEREGRPGEDRRGGLYPVPSICAMQGSNVKPGAPPPSVGVIGPELVELRALILKQQEQINKLTDAMATLQRAPRQTRPNRAAIICRRCQQVGHYAKECDNERVRTRSPSTPSPQQADSGLNSQVVGN
ncbi:uncharacterized protein LOC105355397 [Oryzias latipes]|uniref:uncharacterized protein LOC105355397 n=1 Tax=Oryzias latipes TaxID=8090 RepID=UPI000CE20F6A|nr:uncharacterized protein LOC105355397 [Oryzias latipes]XP_023817650.1 uncharacterized protein LOC105355397 [Oryzias latipes]XP_023817651.1 uncharacterized protein LOC105355397 [Oryzias latipes]XP_023817652.1 uncharacterized protein LOC105355397 [Oryzias latipes]